MRPSMPTKTSGEANRCLYFSICSGVRLVNVSLSEGAPHRKKVPQIISYKFPLSSQSPRLGGRLISFPSSLHIKATLSSMDRWLRCTPLPASAFALNYRRYPLQQAFSPVLQLKRAMINYLHDFLCLISLLRIKQVRYQKH